MKIGLDFDNTLIRYDDVFFRLASQELGVPQSVIPTKNGVRNYLREQNREDEWTELQGLVYGKFIHLAQPSFGMIDTLNHWQNNGVELVLVSHKTQYPYAGPRFDLHEAAREWIHAELWQILSSFPLFFEQTRDDKLQRIHSLGLDAYIDDLPDILLDLNLDVSSRWLYDPMNETLKNQAFNVFSDWSELTAHL